MRTFLRGRTVLTALLLSFGALTSPGSAQGNAETLVRSTGQGASAGGSAAGRQLALSDAVRAAVEQAMGAYITSAASLTSVNGFDDFKQSLTKRADGFGRIVRILGEGEVNGIYTVTAEVAVSKPSLEQAFKAFLGQKGDPRVIVVIPEWILRRTVPDPAAQTEVTRALVNAGYRVVDDVQTRALADREAFRSGQLDPAALAELRTRFRADVLVTGEAFAEEKGNVLGQRGYTARLELKFVDLATGQVFFSDAYTGTGLGATDSVAGKTALQNTARLASPNLPGALLRWLAGNGAVAARTFTVRLLGAPSFTAYNNAVAALRALSGVRGAVSRQFDTANSIVEIEFDGSPEELAALLETAGMSVRALTAGEITATFAR